MALLIEELVDLGVDRAEFLECLHPPEPVVSRSAAAAPSPELAPVASTIFSFSRFVGRASRVGLKPVRGCG